jgi:GNAT superfamily N-acetyltransferase
MANTRDPSAHRGSPPPRRNPRQPRLSALPGHPVEVVTYLEMRSIDDLVAAADSKHISLVEERTHMGDVQSTLQAIGRPYNWPSQNWDDERWDQFLTGGEYRHWFAVGQGTRIGLLTLANAGSPETEIDTFGLLPAYVGKGYGARFLTLACELAWRLNPGLSRLWLHTSTIDHPSALPNYLGCGFTRTDVSRHPRSQ